jgi:large subunit ribosomal protein L10
MAEKRPTVIRQQKVEIIDELVDRIDRASMAVIADYRGLSVAQLEDLRAQLRPAKVEVKIAKNTLLRIAAQRSDRAALLPALEGPTAIVFSFGDPAEMAKVLTETIRTRRLTLPLRSGLLGDRLLPASDVTRIAELPSREVLASQVLGTIQAPISNFVGVLAATLQSFVGIIDARRAQLEEGGEAA